MIEKLFSNTIDSDEGVYDCLVTLDQIGRLLSRRASLKRAGRGISTDYIYNTIDLQFAFSRFCREDPFSQESHSRTGLFCSCQLSYCHQLSGDCEMV